MEILHTIIKTLTKSTQKISDQIFCTETDELLNMCVCTVNVKTFDHGDVSQNLSSKQFQTNIVSFYSITCYMYICVITSTKTTLLSLP